MQQEQIPLNLHRIWVELKDKTIDEGLEKYRDNTLVNLKSYDGWQTFNKIIEGRIERLKSLIDPDSGTLLADTNGDPSRIGITYLVVSFAVYQLRLALNLPNAVVEAQRLDEQRKKANREGRGADKK